MAKKDVFKWLIQEFQEFSLPKVILRDLRVPLDSKKIITVYGPRRSGKSFYFYSLIEALLKKGIAREQILYLNFEDDRLYPLDGSNLAELLDAYYELFPKQREKSFYVFFDEIQNISRWEMFVRRLYDKEPAHIFLTGSSSKLLSREIATSLRGRTLSFPLYPLNFREYLRFHGEEPGKDFIHSAEQYQIKKRLHSYLRFGGFPEVVLEKNEALRNHILQEYFDLLVYRDLAERFSLKNSDLLKDMLRYFFTNITSLFALNRYTKSVQQTLPASRETVSEYAAHILETGYSALLPCFSYSLKQQRVNPRKILALDNGLRNHLALSVSHDRGKLAENLVGQTLLQKNADLYYWKNKHEVDFVLHDRNRLEAFNVSFGEKMDVRESESLLDLKRHFRQVRRLTILTVDTAKKERGIEYMPLYQWLLTEV